MALVNFSNNVGNKPKTIQTHTVYNTHVDSQNKIIYNTDIDQQYKMNKLDNEIKDRETLIINLEKNVIENQNKLKDVDLLMNEKNNKLMELEKSIIEKEEKIKKLDLYIKFKEKIIEERDLLIQNEEQNFKKQFNKIDRIINKMNDETIEKKHKETENNSFNYQYSKRYPNTKKIYRQEIYLNNPS